MAIRTTDVAVREIIETTAEINTAPFILTASKLTDYVKTQDTQNALDSGLLMEIEKYLAAHFYAQRDPQYRSKSTSGASGQFQGQSGMHLDATDWGQTAMVLDVTGTLRSLNQGKARVGSAWLGTPYED